VGRGVAAERRRDLVAALGGNGASGQWLWRSRYW
jgi:hypothetical protein